MNEVTMDDCYMTPTLIFSPPHWDLFFQEERLRRGDDLRLQMALEESRRDTVKIPKKKEVGLGSVKIFLAITGKVRMHWLCT